MNKNLGWEVKTLGEIFLIERGGSPRPIKEYLTDDESGINWIKIGDTKDISKYIFTTAQKIKLEGKKHSRFVEVGDLILSNSMSFGKPYIMKTTGCIHDGWVVLRQSKKVIDEEFAYYILISNEIYTQFNRLATGSTVKNLNIDRIKQIKIPLPPLETQKAIVEKLENAFAHIDEAVRHLKAVQTNIPRLKSSLLHCAFSGKLTESQITTPTSTFSFSQRKSNPSPLPLTKEMLPFFCTKGEPAHSPLLAKNRAGGTTAPAFSDFSHHEVGAESHYDCHSEALAESSKDNNTHTLPQGWEIKTLGEVLSNDKYAIKRGPFGSSLKKEFFVDSGIRVFEQYNPINQDSNWKRYFITQQKFKELESFKASAGDLLISCSGTLGKILELPKNVEIGIINQALLKIRLDNKQILNSYFVHLFNSPYMQNIILENTIGSAIQNIASVKVLKQIKIPLPPLETQNQIVQILESKFAHLEKLAQFVNASLENLQRLKSSLLNQAFKGELV